jgi:periplasmic glucans biosynthesis protein
MKTYQTCLAHLLPIGTILLLALAIPILAAERVTIDLNYVAERASALASEPYDDNWGQVPDFLRQLDYDAYHNIRFIQLRSLWADDELAFRIEFLHPGNVYSRAVRIHEFTNAHAQEIPFATEFFDYGKLEDIGRRVPTSLDYAGFRLLYPLNKAEQFDEVAVFAGASFFRAMARNQGYGISARCLALNTTATEPEEFPLFREFWLGKPEANANHLRFFALIDSPSVAGAYEFILHPGEETVLNIKAQLFFRAIPSQIGLMPFSSMFFFGENTLRKPRDYRPEVHDSDGLLVLTATNRSTWHPINNPPRGRHVREFAFDHAVPFAILQRDRDFEHYQDIGAAYHLRPSVIVEPGRRDDPGRIVLYTFATLSEAVDNVALFWQPDARPEVGEPYAVDYTLRFTSAEPSPMGIVLATRTGLALNTNGLYECVVDFGSDRLAELTDVDPVQAVVESLGEVPVERTLLQKNYFNGTWRLFIQFRSPASEEQARFRAHLEMEETVLTETWEHVWHKSTN